MVLAGKLSSRNFITSASYKHDLGFTVPSATVTWERCAPCRVDPIHPAFRRTLAPVLGVSTKLKHHCLMALRVPITLWEKFSLLCTVSISQGSGVWDLGCGAMACGPCYHLMKNTLMTFGVFHSLAKACPRSDVKTFDDPTAWGVQSKPALHPEWHSHISFGLRWPCLLCHNFFSLALPTSLCSSLSANACFGSHTR